MKAYGSRRKLNMLGLRGEEVLGRVAHVETQSITVRNRDSHVALDPYNYRLELSFEVHLRDHPKTPMTNNSPDPSLEGWASS